MVEVLEHATGDLVVRVEAGVRLDALERRLAAAGQRLPVDEVVAGSTVGGIVATGLCGPSRYRNGAVRDVLTGVTVVRPDGVVIRAGSKVVKNVAGYDLPKLYAGSYGTLGIVTEAIFKLRPRPPARRFVSALFPGEAELAPALAGVLACQADPSAIELDRPASGAPVTLCVLLEGRPGPVAERAGAVAALLGSTVVADEPPDWWAALPGEVTIKATVPLSGVARLLERVGAVAGEHALAPAVRGSAGVGVLFVGLPADAPVGAVGPFLRALRSECEPQSGNVSVLRAPATTKASLDLWGAVPGLSLMRRVKDQFDPQHRMAPGRFVGGI